MNNPTALEMCCRKSKKELLDCSDCNEKADQWEEGTNHFVHLFCSKCQKGWYVCSLCSNQKNKYTSQKQRRRHIRDNHSNSSVAKKQKTTPLLSSSVIDSGLNECENGEDMMDVSTSPSLKECFLSQNSQMYFDMQYCGVGTKYLASKAIFGNQLHNHKITDQEEEMFFAFGKLTNHMTKNGQLILLDFVKKYKALLPIAEMDGQRKTIVDIPSNQSEARKMFLDGKCSLISNLPHAQITKLENHAYCSLPDIVSDFIGHLTRFDDMAWIDPKLELEKVKALEECAAARALYQDLSMTKDDGDELCFP